MSAPTLDDSVHTVSAASAAPIALPTLEGVDFTLLSTNPDKLMDFKEGVAAVGFAATTGIEFEVPEIQAGWEALIVDKAAKQFSELIQQGIGSENAIQCCEDTGIECGKHPKKLPVPGYATKDFIKMCAGNLHHLPALVGGDRDVVYRCSAVIRLPSGETITITATTLGYFVEKRSKEYGCSGKGLIDTQFVPYDDPEQRTISQMPLADRMKYHPRFKLILLIIEELRKRYSF